MIAKLIAVAPDRMEALRRLARSLDQSTIIGPRTNAAFLKALVKHPEVTGADIDTNLIARKMPELTASSLDSQGIRCGLLHLLAREAHSTDGTPLPWQSTDAFQLGGTRSVRRAVDVDGRRIDVKFAWEGTALTISAYELDKAPQQADEARLHITSSGPFVYVLHGLRQTRLSWTAEQSMKLDATDDGGAVRAPINGRLAKVFVEQGAMIKAGERIAVVEAMKMEHVLHAPINGSVSRLVVQEGQQVAEGAMIAHIEPAAE
jgi:3-methylcrotonyl-CoA carboxylase alpha subunit